MPLKDWLKRGEKRPKQKKRIRPMSKKRERENREYLKRRKAFLKAHPSCQAVFSINCSGVSEDVHHSAGRLGGNYLDEKTWIATCRSCHINIHRWPRSARNLGLLAP